MKAKDIAALKQSIERLSAGPTSLSDSERWLIEQSAIDFSAYEHFRLAEIAALLLLRMTEYKSTLMGILYGSKEAFAFKNMQAKRLGEYASAQENLALFLKGELAERVEKKKRDVKKAADAKHDRPGGAREKKVKVQQAWASGNYASRDICAEKICGELEMSFSSARKALRNTPNPT